MINEADDHGFFQQVPLQRRNRIADQTRAVIRRA